MRWPVSGSIQSVGAAVGVATGVLTTTGGGAGGVSPLGNSEQALRVKIAAIGAIKFGKSHWLFSIGGLRRPPLVAAYSRILVHKEGRTSKNDHLGAFAIMDVTEVSANAFGALGDGTTLCTEAIQAAIDQARAGGGTVRFEPGVYLTGALFLKSGVTFRVDKGVRLLGSRDPSDYPILPTRVPVSKCHGLPPSSMCIAKRTSD